MRDFAETAWQPPGKRPHVLLRWAHDDGSCPVHRLGRHYLADLDPGVVRVVPPAVWHLTLAWVDMSI